MNTQKTLSNRYGESWYVEHHESERLTHIGGYLMTYQETSRVIINSQLSRVDKQRCQEYFVEHLIQMATGTNGVMLWHPDDQS